MLRKNVAISKKGNFAWCGKIACAKTFQDLLKSSVSFGGDLEGSNEKNGEETEGRTSIVKYGEMLLEWKSRGLWKSCLWDSPYVTKLLNTFGWIFDSCLIWFCHKTAEIHFLCIQLTNKLGVQKLRHCRAQLISWSKLTPMLIRWKNIKIQVISHCLNSFQHKKYVTFSLLYVLLRECLLVFK